MELSLLLAEQIIVLFLMGAVGYLTVKVKVLKTEDSKVLSTLIVYVLSPCVVVNSFQIEYTEDKMAGLALCFAMAMLVQIIFIAVVWVIGKFYHFDPIEKASMIYTNAGYLVIPLVSGVMGDEWVFYASAYLVVFNILVWTHGVIVIGKGTDMSLKKILLNPNIIGCALGIVLFITQITLPSVIGDCVSGFSKMVGPASMLVIGMLIANLDLKAAFQNSRVYVVCFVRLIILPLIIIAVIKLSGVTALHIYGKQILCIVMFAASAPAATAVTQLAQIYDRDARYAGLINGVSVIFCILTMPLMVYIYEAII